MATLFKNANSPYWKARYFDSNGRRVSKSTGVTQKREAERIAADFESQERINRRNGSALPKAFSVIVETAAREAASGDFTLSRAEELITKLHRLANPSFKVISLSEHLDNWIRDQEPNVSLSTSGVYRDMKRHLTTALGQRISAAPVGELTPDQIKRALMKVKETGLKAATVNMDLRALRRALHVAVTSGLSKANPGVGIKPLPEDDSTERAPFTADEVRQMIDHPKTPEEWKGAILIAAHTGLRLGDVVSLSRDHIDGTKIVIRPGKTKRSKKTITIPLSPPCLAWIGDKKGSFFPTLSKRVPGTLSTVFTRIMASAGVARDVTIPGGIQAWRSFHCLRHSFTSWLAEADVHADVRQKLTGHSSGGIHQRYTHHDDALNRAVGTLPSF